MIMILFVDYQVIDHLYRLATESYQGQHAAALHLFESLATGGRYELWMSEISHVEMLQGRENPKLDPIKKEQIIAKDQAKVEIAERLGVRWLGYPASKLSNPYSRLGVSFRLSGPSTAAANDLESRLEQISDVSPGDVRQVATAIYGFDSKNVETRPSIEWFITEDAPLRTALSIAVSSGKLPELANLRICSVAELVAA
jgi:hypothetical protein